MTPFERALVGELEGSHGDRVHVGDVHGATALHHYAGLNSAGPQSERSSSGAEPHHSSAGHQVNDAVILVRLGHGFPPWNWATVFYRDICMDRNGGPKRMPAVVEDGRGQCRHLFPWSAISQG